MEKRWKKVNPGSASDLIGEKVLSAESQELLQPETGPEGLFEVLMASEQWLDAAKVMAHALPRREAVWWLSVCAGKEGRAALSETDEKCSEAAVKWAQKPKNKHRQAAFRMSQEGESESPWSLAALAVAFSGGPVTVPGDQTFEVDDAVFPQLIAAGILSTAMKPDMENAYQRIQEYLHIGEDIALGHSGLKKLRKKGK